MNSADWKRQTGWDIRSRQILARHHRQVAEAKRRAWLVCGALCGLVGAVAVILIFRHA